MVVQHRQTQLRDPSAPPRRLRPSRAATFAVGALLAFSVAGAAPLRAEDVWVKDEVTINLRTGPGNQYRITGALQTGDAVQILSRGDGWTEVRVPDGREGWVPAGFLMDQPPATMRVERMEHENHELRGTVESLREELNGLRGERGRLQESEAAERDRAQELEAENLELKAGARWPEWITGAGILASGMLVGSLVQTWASRRPRSRIRL